MLSEVDGEASYAERLLASDNGGNDDTCTSPLIETTTYPAGCDDHKWHRVHIAHDFFVLDDNNYTFDV